MRRRVETLASSFAQWLPGQNGAVSRRCRMRVWARACASFVLGSGKAGHEVNALGVAEALGAPYALQRVDPRRPFVVDVAVRAGRSQGRAGRAVRCSPALPDIVIACGRVTVPYMRAFKRAGGERVFAVFLQDPRFARAHGPDLGSRARSPSRAQRHRDADLAASVLAAPARRRARRARRAARRAAEPALRGRARRPERRATFHAGRRRAAVARRCGRSSAQGFSDHGDAVAPHAAGTHRRGARRARRRAGLRLGRDGRQSLRLDPRAGRRGSGDRRQRQHGRRGDRDRRAGACLRAVGRRRRTSSARRSTRWSGSARCAGSPARSSASPTSRSIRAAVIAAEIARRFLASARAAA